MTQGQWIRLEGRNPSYYPAGSVVGGGATSLLTPVENVSWQEAADLLTAAGLALPTEAQWEHAARGGTRTPWWTGKDVHSLAGAANLADASARRAGAPASWSFEEGLDDGWVGPAPVGSFRANPFGLHDVVGNVCEWCLDEYGPDGYRDPPRPGDGMRHPASARGTRVVRDGCFALAAAGARVASRDGYAPETRLSVLGVRPASAVGR